MLPALALGCAAEIGYERAASSHDDAEQTVTVSSVADAWAGEDGWRVSPALEAPEGATRVGALLALEAPGPMPEIEARAVDGAGAALSDWRPVTPTWSEEDHHVAVAELGVTASAAQIRIRVDALPAIRTLRWSAVVPESETEAQAAADGVAGSRAALRSELGRVGVVARESWGARATRCTSRNTTKTRMAIHYTVTPSENPERQVRAIQRYHMDSRGWCDVGYHFLVGIDGTVYEGRPLHLLGSHVGGHNTNNIGISFVGCFDPSCRSDFGPKHPPDVMLRGAAGVMAELSRLYGISLDRARVKGHREHSGASTSCPGTNLLSRMDDLLAMARSGGSTPPPADDPPAGDPPPTEGASCAHTYGGSYGHLACSAGYQCCDGRWRTRGACGSCACVEPTGEVGCGATPPGDPCTHTYGGTYGHLACSPGYQCCDGRWRTRGACGACTCTEETGARGCGT